MAIRAKFETLPELVKPKLTDIAVELIPPSELVPASTADGTWLSPDVEVTSVSDAQQASGGYKWTNWTISFSLSNIRTLSKDVKKFLEFYAKVTKVVVQILKIIRLFSGLSKSLAVFIKFLIKMLADSLKELIDSLASTGLYACVLMDKSKGHFAFGGSETHGGFQELITRVNYVCSSSDDPDAPRFNNEHDKVGGVIIAAVAGTSNPEVLKDLRDSISKIGKFFGFDGPQPEPAANFKVTPGFYRDFSDHQNKDKKMGVALTWEDPEKHVDGFAVFRTTNIKGRPRMSTEFGIPHPYRVPTDNTTDDQTKDQLTYVNSVRGNLFYRYTDFDVKSGVQYYYKVYSTYDEKWLNEVPYMKDVQSSVSTPFRSAKCKNCIPVSELKEHTVQKLNGEFLDALLDWKSDWQSFTVRSVMSKQLDILFAKIDMVADRLTGIVNTSSDAMSKYLDRYEKRIQKLVEIMDEITKIIDFLMSLTLRGTFLVLSLPIEDGGMAGFLSRFNAASNVGRVDEEKNKANENFVNEFNAPPDNPFELSNDGGIAQYTEKGVYFGVILLFGFPEINKERLEESFLPEDTGGVEAQIKTTQKAIETLLKLLGLGG